MRYSGGVRWEAGEQFEMDIGYFYEARRPDAGHNRHMFLTSFHFRFPASGVLIRIFRATDGHRCTQNGTKLYLLLVSALSTAFCASGPMTS